MFNLNNILTTTVDTSVATHLENLEKSGNLRVAKVCSCIWSITASIDLDTECAKRNYLLGVG